MKAKEEIESERERTSVAWRMRVEGRIGERRRKKQSQRVISVGALVSFLGQRWRC